MAVIHFQYESIHPFYDGNGRIGKIINILYLVLQGLLELPVQRLDADKQILELSQKNADLFGEVCAARLGSLASTLNASSRLLLV